MIQILVFEGGMDHRAVLDMELSEIDFWFGLAKDWLKARNPR